MPANYVLLERIELNASAASVTFANIPQTGYTDLLVSVSSRSSTAGVSQAIYIKFNAITTGYTSRNLYGSGTAVASNSSADGYIGEMATGSTATTSAFGSGSIYIPNYAGSTNKSYSTDWVTENNATAAYAGFTAGLMSNTAAITSITLTSSFVQYSTFSLYGIAALGTTPAIAPKASGGNVIATDGTYWYHAFRTSGTFTPAVSLTADCLVIAGGGGGFSSPSNGSGVGGAGGAGGGGAGGKTKGTAGTANTGGGGGGGDSTPGNGGSGLVIVRYAA